MRSPTAWDSLEKQRFETKEQEYHGKSLFGRRRVPVPVVTRRRPIRPPEEARSKALIPLVKSKSRTARLKLIPLPPQNLQQSFHSFGDQNLMLSLLILGLPETRFGGRSMKSGRSCKVFRFILRSFMLLGNLLIPKAWLEDSTPRSPEVASNHRVLGGHPPTMHRVVGSTTGI